MTMRTDDLLDLLVGAVAMPSRRAELISRFQQIVWHSEELSQDSRVEEILRSLAHDLDLYEPDLVVREEDPQYFGWNRAEREILCALEQLNERGIVIPSVSSFMR